MLQKKLAICLVLTLTLTGCVSAKTSDKSSSNKTKPTLATNVKTTTDPKTTNNVTTTVPETKKTDVTPTVDQKPVVPVVLPNTSGLQTKTIGWSWEYSPRDCATLLSKYQGYAMGDTSKKVLYLTFDEGYENGYTPSILDTLKANNVHAAFFCTAPYVTGSYNGVKDTELLKRMMNEGHIIGNHSVQHKSMPLFTTESAFDAELTGVESAVNSVPGIKMSKFFRPPAGEFSELSLYYTQKLGYKSIFFAFAYNDYTVENQPDPVAAKAKILQYTKPGIIILLHAVSKTNATILDSLIKEWKSQGYEFKTLNELP